MENQHTIFENNKSCLDNDSLTHKYESEKQISKVQVLWVMLGGEHYGHVTLNNLRMMLLAVKGVHIQPEAPLLTMTSDT